MKIKKLVNSALSAIVISAIISVCSINALDNYFKIFRTSGVDRYKTSVAVSKDTYNSSKSVIIASGEGFADALAGSQLSIAMDAPILLTGKYNLDPAVLDEINRLDAQSVYILGGENTISKNIEESLVGKNVFRIAGKDRYETCNKIIEETMKYGHYTNIVIVSGTSFPDALSSAAYLKASKSLLVLSDGTMPKFDKNLHAVAIGGENTLKLAGSNIPRIAGKNRYETAVQISSASSNLDASFGRNAVFVNGEKFVDSLPAVDFVNRKNASIILTPNHKYTYSDYKFVKELENLYVVGGENSISRTVVDWFEQKATQFKSGKPNKDLSVVEIDKTDNNEQTSTQKVVAQFLNGKEFGLSSGVGAWGSYLKFGPNLTITGVSNDRDMQNIYVCEFSGRFEAEKVNDSKYNLKLVEFNITSKTGTKKVTDYGIENYINKAIGIDKNDKYELYLPGTKTTDMPQGAIEWLRRKNSIRNILDKPVIYNVNEEQLFIHFVNY